jgi:hypothetical protein
VIAVLRALARGAPTWAQVLPRLIVVAAILAVMAWVVLRVSSDG